MSESLTWFLNLAILMLTACSLIRQLAVFVGTMQTCDSWSSYQIYLSIGVNNVLCPPNLCLTTGNDRSPSQNNKWNKGMTHKSTKLFSLRAHICGHLLWFLAHGRVWRKKRKKVVVALLGLFKIKHASFHYCYTKRAFQVIWAVERVWKMHLTTY